MATKDFIGYQALIDKAFRGVVREALTHAAKGGVMGSHHFYIAFDTQAAGVQMSDFLRENHPHEMTIVLQHKYWDLKVSEERFEVTLTFNKMPETIVVPFAAIRQFSDPSQGFGFKFQTAGVPGATVPGAGVPAKREDALPVAKPATEPPKPAPAPEEPGQIVSLDKFRKK
jgi:hypothetical protein